jgi:hypothetical protein
MREKNAHGKLRRGNRRRRVIRSIRTLFDRGTIVRHTPAPSRTTTGKFLSRMSAEHTSGLESTVLRCHQPEG